MSPGHLRQSSGIGTDIGGNLHLHLCDDAFYVKLLKHLLNFGGELLVGYDLIDVAEASGDGASIDRLL